MVVIAVSYKGVLRFFWGVFFCSLYFILPQPEVESKVAESGRAGFNYPVASKAERVGLVLRENETLLQFVGRANKATFESIYHCNQVVSKKYWLENSINTLINKNGLAIVRSVLGTNKLRGFLAPEQQGVLSPELISCGLCHQSAYILARILRDNGIDANVFGLIGHVIVKFKANTGMYYVDPDFGVGPFKVDDPALAYILLPAYEGATSKSNAINILGMYLSLENNGPYYTMAYLDNYALGQLIIYRTQQILPYLALLLGFYLLWRQAIVLIKPRS